jgi:hypothetical protein
MPIHDGRYVVNLALESIIKVGVVLHPSRLPKLLRTFKRFQPSSRYQFTSTHSMCTSSSQRKCVNLPIAFWGMGCMHLRIRGAMEGACRCGDGICASRFRGNLAYCIPCGMSLSLLLYCTAHDRCQCGIYVYLVPSQLPQRAD